MQRRIAIRRRSNARRIRHIGHDIQFASTALTVTANAAPGGLGCRRTGFAGGSAGELLSPGASTCNFAKAPAITGMAGLVLLLIAG